MNIAKIRIKENQFNVPLCSAIDQRQILLHLAKYGLEGLISGLALDSDKKGAWERFGIVVIGVLLNKMPQNITLEICDKLLAEAMVHDPENPQKADLEFFSGKMEDYFELVKEALKHNFKGFFPYLDLIKSSLIGQDAGDPVEMTKR